MCAQTFEDNNDFTRSYRRWSHIEIDSLCHHIITNHINMSFSVFQSGDRIFYWYLLLSGEVQLYIPTAKVLLLFFTI